MIEKDGGIIPETDAMGQEKFWLDIGRPDDGTWALNIFKQECCDNCSCKN